MKKLVSYIIIAIYSNVIASKFGVATAIKDKSKQKEMAMNVMSFVIGLIAGISIVI